MTTDSTIAVFGGTGRSGKPTLRRLLDAGFSVRAQARNPASIDLEHPRLTVIKGSFTDPASVHEVIRGADAVVSLVGHVKDSPKDLLTTGLGYVIHAMNEQGIKRIVNLTGAGVPHPKDTPKVIDKVFRFVMGTFLKDVIHDATESSFLLRASDLDYTNVRGPRLTEGAAKGTLKEGYVGQLNSSLTREDLATFLVDVLVNDRYIKDEPAVSN